jgi:hypothetical protein
MIDLRLPIGIFFMIVGAVLAIYGALNPAYPERVQINVDLYWGICLAIFGILMALFGWMAQRRGETTGGTGDPPGTPDRPVNNRP